MVVSGTIFTTVKILLQFHSALVIICLIFSVQTHAEKWGDVLMKILQTQLLVNNFA